MRYLSVCSGIEAASVAWQPLGWEAVAFAEIDPFPCAVLENRFPGVPNLGDFTRIEATDGPVDVLVGGTPCQSFSVAGRRAGLDDPRGNLAIEFLRLARRVRPRWLVWENVPGVLSSNGGRDFGAFLGMLAELGYGWAYRVLDAQHFGVPQRRRRVLVVGHLGDWRRAAAVLFERGGLLTDLTPRREAREGTPCGFETGPHGGDFSDLAPTLDTRCKDGPIRNQLGMGVVHSLRADGFDASEDGTGRGTPLVPVAIQEQAVCENPDAGPGGAGFRTDGMAYTLLARTVPQAVAFSCKDYGADTGDTAPTLRAMGHDGSHANAGGQVAVASWQQNSMDGRGTLGYDPDTKVLRPVKGQPDHQMLQLGLHVRRLTPRECERLQGFPDDWTLVPYRGKPASDGPRYKAIGNSMAVPVIRWLGQRIQMADNL